MSNDFEKFFKNIFQKFFKKNFVRDVEAIVGRMRR